MKAFSLALFCAIVSSVFSANSNDGVKITKLENKLRVEIGGKLFTEYYFKNVPRPFCYPLIGPGDLPVTRNWPMKETPGEERDHLHHRSLWFGHEKVNGNDFWSEEKNFGKQVPQKFTEISSGEKFGVITSQNNWVSHEGKIICTDDRTLKIYNQPNPKIFDFEITIHADHGELWLGDSKDAGMSIRVAETMRPMHGKDQPGDGHIVMSSGISDDSPSVLAARKEKREDNTWGKRADWVDYFGPVNGKIVGIAIFDHPKNYGHPTHWHVRDYGLFTANPFGLHYFEKKPEGAGDLKIPAGQSVTFRYRFVLHEGNEKQGKIAELYQKFISEKSK
ncbi:MAG: PmoA family protein [Verrucomicrobiota bacterium]|nr:PmoA family protein [Verrucomicrobiota bacterium]